jgi:hypothetical protein
VPLSELQIRLLHALAEHRSPESYVAGASPLVRAGARYSADIDVFHDREETVQAAALADAATLESAGFRIDWARRQPALFVAVVHGADDATRIEWAVDSDFRFFPVVPDETFGYVLHLADIATNKALAAAGRREPRDVIDLMWIDRHYLSLGAVVWAAVAKDPGFTPEGLLAEISRTSRYQQADFDRLRSEAPISAAEVSRQLRAALWRADAFVRAMPAGREGLLFLRAGRPVQPEPTELETCVPHAGERRGHWPSSFDITSAMLERYGRGEPD